MGAIVARGLTKRYGSSVAVDGVSLEVRQGEVVGLLGPDGAGKTTLLRMLCAVLSPDAGTAQVAGADTREAPEQVKARIGYMPQAFALYDDLTVRENLRFVAEMFGVPRALIGPRMDRLLAAGRLQAAADRLAGHLSGGMRQKLALAATVMHEPEVLVLDEPTTGVDPVSRREFWEILYDLNRQGKTILVATPYMDEAERCARVALMHQGRLLAVEAPRTLRARMPGVILEVVAAPRRAALQRARELPGVIRAHLFGHALHAVVSRDADGPRLREALTAQGIVVESVRAVEPSLEDVFVALLATHPDHDDTRH
ncbi:MAG: ABC transporter ATP-binding protein [Armatimonadota bacterium]|nr:ABC transporter ATP-binding protein [Armatimonadota bacterium]MDR7436838.1 ABC transporter ATP-binding protein [Armatimonadota bacterium]MDR7471621.1 ABC transporter ATP-binding protein [Armatimonadota bacterium]MDR7507931.1 ABC transporter ATP-binding protein [Armatimonadota bacterium]MDR7509638.1 ABC transporter ATP-binding protein [Armatimonadota bacterium]